MVWFTRVIDLTDRDQPHSVESSVFNFRFLWPNTYHVPHKESQWGLWSTSVSKGSDDTFTNTDWTPGPSSPAPCYNSLSPCPPHFQTAEEDQQEQEIDWETNRVLWSVNKRISRAHSIAEELANTLYQVQNSQGQELDQFAFREGGLTYHQLQQLDQINHPDIYNKATDTGVAGPLLQYQEDEQHLEGEEWEEHLEEELPLPHHLCTPEQTQQEDSSNKTQISEESSATSTGSENSSLVETPIVPFPNKGKWTLWLNEQLDRVFQ